MNSNACTMRTTRALLDLTQAELGARLGVSRGHVNRVENSVEPLSLTLGLALEALRRRATAEPIEQGER